MHAGANVLGNVQVCESSRMHIMSFYNFLVVAFQESLGLLMLFKMVFKQTKPYYHIYLLLLCYVKLQLVSSSHVCIMMQTVTAWMQRCSISCRYGDCCTGEHCVPVCLIQTNQLTSEQEV